MPLQLVIYNVLYLLLLLVLFPFLSVAALFFTKYKTGFLNRFGLIPPAFKKKVKGFENIWLHAASAGEVKCILPLVAELRKKYPAANIVFTTTGLNGQRMLGKAAKDIPACYLPLDFYFLLKPLVLLINPKILVVAETEYWPNLFYLAGKQGARLVVVNGRFSKKAVRRYRFTGPLIKKVFALTAAFAMRSREDAAILLKFGVSPEKIFITGDLKYEKPVINGDKKEALETALRPVLKEKIMVFGSVHYKEAGEILAAFKLIKAETPGITFILAPRFMEEIPALMALLEAESYFSVKRSNPGKVKADVVILDTFGELSYAYGLCAVAFVGGSLAGGIGGHNLLEPAYLGKPVLFGPHAFNFKEMATEIINKPAGFLVRDSAELAAKAAELLANPLMLQKIRQAAFELLENRKGSLLKTLELL
ncbi:MAG: hypothetical protein NTX32_01525 [Candidatus Firestonebacteria bacterium]|nr:hypothetical protein [Candidatus Firestonebacteria bacterium]